METYSLTCQNCGAPLIVAKSAREATCNHCGTRVGIKPAKRDPEIVILDSPKPRKPPIRSRPEQPVRVELVEEPYDPAQKREDHEHEQIQLMRHGANLLDAATGYRSCMHVVVGMAILGGLMTCGLCGLPGILRWTQLAQNGQPARPKVARADKTDDMLEDAARWIDARARTNQSLPSADVGNSSINGYRDEWGRNLRYEKNSTSDFVIRSAGPDGVFDTADDITERHHSTSIQRAPQVAQPAFDLASALQRLQTPGLFQKDAALEWLIAEKPDLEEPQRGTIVDSAILLLKERQTKSLAQSALTLWAQPGDAAKLAQAAAHAQPREVDYVDAIVIQLIRIKDEDSVMMLMNHPSRSVRASVGVAMSDWNVTDERIVQQCLADLDRPERQQAAVTRLTSMMLNATQQAAATAAVKRLLIDGVSNNLGMLALDFLEHRGAVDTALLIKVYDRANDPFHRDAELRERAGLALTQRLEPSVFLLFASHLSSRDRETAETGATALKTMGPAAESYVWPSLRSEDPRVRERACGLLAAIGTENSLPHLLTIDTNGPTGPHAQAAIQDIQNAQRQPVQGQHDQRQPASSSPQPTAPS